MPYEWEDEYTERRTIEEGVPTYRYEPKEREITPSIYESGISSYTPYIAPTATRRATTYTAPAPSRGFTELAPPRPTLPPEPTITTWMPRGPRPTYEAPEYGRERVSELQQMAMAPQMSRLRRALSKTLMESRYADSPMVRMEARRRALRGYGEAIPEVSLGARREAMAEYAPEYAAAVAKARLEYRTAEQEYLQTGERITGPARRVRNILYDRARG